MTSKVAHALGFLFFIIIMSLYVVFLQLISVTAVIVLKLLSVQLME